MPAHARLYLELARRGFRRWAAYPGATIAGLFTNTIFGFIRGYILLALFTHRADVAGYDVSDTLTYTWLTQALIATVFMWGWYELAYRIRSGDIATDLYRPLDMQLAWLAQDLGRGLYHFLFRGIPPFVVGALVFDLTFPRHAYTWIAFLVSVVLAIVVSFAWRWIVNLAAFWLMDWRGTAIVSMVLMNFFSGFIIPIAFFPEWLRDVAYALPFAAMIQLSIDVFLEKPAGIEIAGVLAVQAAWALVLLLAGRAIFAAGTRKLVVQGG